MSPVTVNCRAALCEIPTQLPAHNKNYSVPSVCAGASEPDFDGIRLFLLFELYSQKWKNRSPLNASMVGGQRICLEVTRHPQAAECVSLDTK